MARIGKRQSGRSWEVYLDEPTYQQLRRKAAALINRETSAVSAEGDDLLQEVMLRLLQSANFSCTSPDHFRAIMSLRMSQVLIDMVRAIKTAKRGCGFQHVSLDENTLRESGSVSQNLIVGQTLSRLGVRQVRLRQVLELRMAGKAPLNEIAAELSVSVRTVKRDLAKATKWMRQELSLTPMVSEVKGPGKPPFCEMAA